VAKRRILVVDDESDFLQMVKSTLENTGSFDVRAENRPRNAVASAREFKPDMIFLDVFMPQMDGGDVVAKLQADPELGKIPVVFMTSLVAKRETPEGQLQSGGMRFLAKPVTVKSLLQCIEETLGK
jgi:CheY-like chemotaxis protein